MDKRFAIKLATLIIISSCLAGSALAQTGPAFEWHLLYMKIRDRIIPREEALVRLRKLEVLLRNSYSTDEKKNSTDGILFPLRGYDVSSVGGKRGNGYKIQGYDFFDGNDHKGHPGHDIFIPDRNQDGIDDETGKPVSVVSVTPGIVVSIHQGWDPASHLRGGNYVWIYEPMARQYYYYAHMDGVLPAVGQTVSQGEPLGTVGRTGANACKKRSPTHLHFAVHQSVDGVPVPIDPYGEWKRRRKRLFDR